MLSLYMELSSIQRLLTAAIQQNQIHDRIFQSFQTLRKGFLPEDYVSRRELGKILEMVKDEIPDEQRVAFDENQMDNYFVYPLHPCRCL